MNYEDFIKNKKHLTGEYGFECNYIPDMAFDFQRYIIEKSIKKGRTAIFADTGLGKTLIQLAIANNIIRETNKKVLILTPLAVAFQFILEAEKLGISDIEYSKNGTHTKKIVICNYERLHYFNESDFVGVICDESSILKNFDGKIKNNINSFIRKIPYRFLSTATPSPNDYIELGTSSEALGNLGYMDMLSKFFANAQNSIDVSHIGCEWYLKPHAEKDFWKWVSGWSISLRKPSDLGFSDNKFILPKLTTNINKVSNDKQWVVNDQYKMFGIIAKNMSEVRQEQKMTIENRCERAVELSSNYENSVYWCNFNDEGNLLEKLDNNAIQISGTMDIDKKEEILINFSKGEIKKLITKPKITAFGLNWQHCNHTVFFPTWSYEQYYQSIRRFWRFGQKREVICDIVISEGQNRILDSLEQKKNKAIDMFQHLTENINQKFEVEKKEFNKTITKPKFL